MATQGQERACMTEPKQLIEITNDGKLYYNKHVANELQKLAGNVHVVSCIGNYRTGKSYMMSRLSDNVKAFEIGSTHESVTRGVWVMAKPHPIHPEDTLLLVDTEGLDDVINGNEDKDIKLFALIVLTSSTILYNVQRTLNAGNIEKLHTVLNMAQKWIHPNENQLDIALQNKPQLEIIIQFSELDLPKEDQQPISPRKFMENALSSRNGKISTETKAIRDAFQERNLHILEAASGDRNTRKKLHQVKDNQLDPQFVWQFNKLKEYLFKSVKPFNIDGGLFNVKAWLNLILYLVENQNSVPNIKSQSESIREAINAEARTKALVECKSMIDRLEDSLPIENNLRFKQEIKKMAKYAIGIYKKNALDGVDSFQEELHWKEMELEKQNESKIHAKQLEEKRKEEMRQHEMEMEKKKKEHQLAQQKKQQEHDMELTRKRKQHDEEMKRKEQERILAEREKQREYEREMDRQRQQHEQEMKRQEQERKNAEMERQRQHDREMEQIRLQHQKDQEARDKRHQRELEHQRRRRHKKKDCVIQ